VPFYIGLDSLDGAFDDELDSTRGQMDDHIGIIDEFASNWRFSCYPGDIACAGRLEMTDVIYTAVESCLAKRRGRRGREGALRG